MHQVEKRRRPGGLNHRQARYFCNEAQRVQFTQRFAEVQSDAHKRLFLDLYGTDVFDDQRFAAGYARFVAGVEEYFKDRPQDLLIIDVTAGEGWEKLCPFLGSPVPDVPFPKANVMCKAVDYPGSLGIPVFDYHVPMLSLPALFQTDIDTVPPRLATMPG